MPLGVLHVVLLSTTVHEDGAADPASISEHGRLLVVWGCLPWCNSYTCVDGGDGTPGQKDYYPPKPECSTCNWCHDGQAVWLLQEDGPLLWYVQAAQSERAHVR